MREQERNPIVEGARLIMGSASLAAGRPYEFTGWRDETMSWKKTAYLGTNLMSSPMYAVKGPDVANFFNKICVNQFENFMVGKIRHGIICNEKGQIMTDGVIMKVENDLYRTYWLNPILEFLVNKYKNEFNITGENFSGKEYFFQIAGPLSLQILENASGSDLHDIEFGNHRMMEIAGKDARILRLGMTGNLAFELHGDIADTADVYDCVWNTGKEVGMRKLSQRSYTAFNHTEGGFPNINIHYPMPWHESEDAGFAGLSDFLASRPDGFMHRNRILEGSVGDNLQTRFVNPIDCGWTHKIRFDHEFMGRSALQKIAANPTRTVVTLEWNADDVMDVFSTQLRGTEVEPCEYIENPSEWNLFAPGLVLRADKVLANGKEIGISTGRIISQYYRRMISLGFIDPKYTKIGNELVLVWGTPGTPQKDIRVKVERFPYFDKGR